MFCVQGSGSARRPSSSRPDSPKRSETGQGLPKASRLAWIRFFSITRWRTRWSRKRARSRSARISRGPGSHIAGTRSRRESSARTQASILSVLQASGARPFTFCASAISTSQPMELEAVVDKAGTVHRLDRRVHRSAEGRHFLGEVTEPVEIGRGLGDGELLCQLR